MLEPSVLDTLLLRLESPDEDFQLVTAQDASGWPSGTLELLSREGLLAAAPPMAVYTCTDCARSHTEEIVRIESPPGSEPRMYIPCPSVGRVRLDPKDLLQWRLSLEGWARLVSKLLGLAGPRREAIPGRVWWIGVANLGGATREVLLVRGLGWQADGRILMDRIAVQGEAAPPAIVTPLDLPDRPPICSLPLSLVLRLADGAFLMDRVALDLLINSWPATTPASSKTVEPAIFRPSEDFRTAVLRGVTYTFTTRQAQVIEVLYENHQNGTTELSQEYILERIGSESASLTLRDVFRNSNAWRTLVVQGSRRGMYRLDL